MTGLDVWLAWNWKYDAGFVALFARVCKDKGLSLLSVTPDNLEAVLQSIGHNRHSCRLFWDRASDSDDRFLPLVRWARTHAGRRINAYELSSRASDKTIMHRLLMNDVRTPATIIVPPCAEQPESPSCDLSALGSRFSVKPARRGGGEGVVIGATSLDQVQIARQEYPEDPYLVQAHVEPNWLGFRQAWFRIVYALGEVFPCWWDSHTHVYNQVTAAEEVDYGLGPLHGLVNTIADRCGLDVFSTEIALTGNSFVGVDYVNDPLDLRLQSACADGVPDTVVAAVAERVVSWASGADRQTGSL